MPSVQQLPTLPRVAAVLVVSDAAAWVGNVLATLAAQRYPALHLIVVDNGCEDGSSELLTRYISSDRLIRLPERVGFGRAVAAALTHPQVDGADLVLLLHDDLVLAPNALAHLVRALREDPTLSVVGPKLREWSDEKVLAEVGMTIDALGRAERLLEPGELDQGQHDRQREVLYVSTAGMLVRREVFRGVGGFDPRFTVLRDDLDLCWRAWLAGHRVEVVPAAVGYHVAAISRLQRPVGKGQVFHARELAERHTLAAMLKNYGALRLAWVLPLVALVALARILAFLATRRFGDALAVVRAYGWNLAQLPRTLRRRRAVQRRRQLSDSELGHLFAPGIPRVRAYTEALGQWLAGGNTRALYDDEDAATPEEVADPLAGRSLTRVVRDRPAAAIGALLGLVYLVGILPLLGAGPLVGGDVAPWPDTPMEFLRAYTSSWSGQPVASAAFASPVQPLLGAVSVLGFGSAWLAQRLVVLGLPVLAWLLALRAGRLLTARPAPRALGATLYVLSPPVLGSLATGRFGILVVAALLPAIVLSAARAADPNLRSDTGEAGAAWRAAALLALSLPVAVAAAPSLGPVLAAGYLAGVAIVLARRQRTGPQPALRLLIAGISALGLLSPWLVGLMRGGTLAQGAVPGRIPLWRAVTLAPAVLPDLAGPGGILVAATTVAVVVVALLLGWRHRPGVVAALVALLVLAGFAGWLTGLVGGRVWPPALLLPGALALGGLAVVAARWLGVVLREHAFGARQLVVILAVLVVAVGLVGGLVRVATGPWAGLAREPELLPAFVTADAPRVGPYRVVVLHDDAHVVTWDVTGATGPAMVEFGASQSEQLLTYVEEAVAAVAGGHDPKAGQRLGVANVRYVVLTPQGASPRLRDALARQPALEPLPGETHVYRVRSWLPRAIVLPLERGEALLARGEVGDTLDLETQGLRQVGPGRYVGNVAEPGILVVSEAESRLWRARSEGVAFERRDLGAVNAFAKPQTTAPVVVFAAGAVRHNAVLVVQALLLLAVVSLALRPPRIGQRRQRVTADVTLPSALAVEQAQGKAAAEESRDEAEGRVPEVRQ